MDWDELLALITVGSVAPYVTEAAIYWITRRHNFTVGATNSPP